MTKKQRGFTLIEVIISVSLILIISSLAFSFFSFGLRNYESGTVNTDIQFNARLAVDQISNKIRYLNANQLSEIDLTSDGIKSQFSSLNQEYNYQIIDTDKDGSTFFYTLVVSDDSSRFARPIELSTSVVILNYYSSTLVSLPPESEGSENEPGSGDNDEDDETKEPSEPLEPSIIEGSIQGDNNSFSFSINNQIEELVSVKYKKNNDTVFNDFLDYNEDIEGNNTSITFTGRGTFDNGDYEIVLVDNNEQEYKVTLNKNGTTWTLVDNWLK